MECEFCKKTFVSKGNLKVHQLKTKSCLDIQNKKPEKMYDCLYCDKKFTIKDILDRHIASHISDPIFIKFKKTEEELKNVTSQLSIIQDQVKVFQEETKKLTSLSK